MTAWDVLAVIGALHLIGWAGLAVAVVVGRMDCAVTIVTGSNSRRC